MTIKCCPIWQTPVNELPTLPAMPGHPRIGSTIDSPRAGGHYFFARGAETKLRKLDVPTKISLTSWLVYERERGDSCPELSNNFQEYTTRYPLLLSVHQRARNLLQYLGERSNLLGTVVKFSADISSKTEWIFDGASELRTAYELLAWTASRQTSEVIALVEYCADEGWIKYRTYTPTGSSKDIVYEMVLRPPGYERIGKS